jgi:hypothetical protein
MSERASAVEIVRVGKQWRLSCFQHVPHPIQKVFSFFGSARNLERLTLGFLRFQFRRLPTEPLQAGRLSITNSAYMVSPCGGVLGSMNGVRHEGLWMST